MPGQVRGSVLAVELAHRRGVRRVQPHPLAGQQVVVHRLTEEGMTEGVLVVTRPHQDAGVDRRAQGDVELVLGHRGNRGQQVVRHPLTGGGGHAYGVARALLETVEPDEQEVGQVFGQAPAASQERPTSSST